VAQILGYRPKAWEPRTCTRGKPVDARGLHRLSCRKSSPRQQRHSSMNDILWKAVKRRIFRNKGTGKMGNAQMAAHWSHGPEASQWPGMSLSQTHRPMQSHTLATLPQRQVQRRIRQRKPKSPSTTKLASMHIFYPVATETWNHWADESVQKISRRATLITGELRQSTFIFQQLSTARRRGNAVAFLNTFDSD